MKYFISALMLLSFQSFANVQLRDVGVVGLVSHDILPGRVKLFDRPILKEIKLTNPIFAKLRLNEKELSQELKTFDGDYDFEYKNIKIPFTKVVLNLMEIDRKFIEKFSPYKQADMMAELKKVGEGKMTIKEVFFTHHVYELMEKAICPTNNEWMPKEVLCF